MEKKKLLLVAVSVGVVLLIIMGIPLAVVGPKQGTDRTLQASPGPMPGYQGVLPRQPPQIAETDGTGDAASPSTAAPVTATVQTARERTAEALTLTVPAPRTVAVPEPVASTAGQTPARQPAPAAQQPARTGPAQVPPAATPAPAPAPQRAAPAPQRADPAPARPQATVRAATGDSFWVQVGAYSSKVRAETVKEALESKGIASIIENRNVNGDTVYRVRIGPYMSENEAKFWIPLVQEIGYAESQVRVSQISSN